MTAEEWRERLATLPHKEIQRLLKGEPALTAQISAGFRPGAEALKNPVVLKRLAEALPKTPKLAEALEAVPISEPRTHPPGPLPSLKEGGDGGGEDKRSGEKREGELGKLREKVKEQRTLLKEKDALLAEQTARLSQLEKERDAALVERESERKAREAVEVKLERERRRKAPEPDTPKLSSPSSVQGRGQGMGAGGFEPRALTEALNRLLLRGQDATVLSLCAELLTDETLPLVVKAGIQGVYAAALESLGSPDAAEQSRRAAEAFLGAGQPLEAAEAFVRSLTRATPNAAERALLQRLLALTERRGELAALGRLFARQRLTQPTASACLSKGLESVGKKYPELLPTTNQTRLGPDEAVALPTKSKSVASVTARRLVQAVDEGNVALVEQARAGITELRAQKESLADALLAALSALSPPALATLTSPRLRPVVVDASNVARHIADPLAALVAKKPTASVAQLALLREFLLQHGFFPVLCIADANLRHLANDKPLYATLVERHIVRETLPGTSADELLLTEARAHHAPLVTNDRLSDWGERAEGIERLGFTIHRQSVTLLPA